MCGIVCALDINEKPEILRPQLLEMSKKLRHRGPDWSGIFSDENVVLAHERLAIVDPKSGKQPLYSKDGRYVLAANGEIYNHLELREKYAKNHDFLTDSDCEIIIALYHLKGKDFLNDLNGIFGFVLYDSFENKFLISRDHIGIIPLYVGWDKKNKEGKGIIWEGTGVNEIGRRADNNEIVIRIDPKYFRPTEVDFLKGDASKAKKKLGWRPKISFISLVKEMIKHELNDSIK